MHRDRHRPLLALSVLCLLALAATAVAQEPGARPGMIGLSASLQGSQQGIQLPVWVSEQVVLAPSIAVLSASDIGTDLSLGALLRFNLDTGRAVPYLGLRAAILMYSPDEGDSTTDVVFGPAVGGEYFLGDRLSVGVEAQLNVAMSDEASSRFGNPDGTNINTATAVQASFYF